MKLTLINPPEIQGYTSDRDKAGGIGVAKPRLNSWRTPYLPPTPPLDLLYAVAIAEKEGVPLSFIDCIGLRLGQKGLEKAIAEAAPSHIGLRVSLPSLNEDLALANRLKRRFPASQIFIFGQATHTTYTQWISHCEADAVFHGEVEALLMPYLRGDASAHVLQPKAGPTFCANWAYVEDLDALPMPAWHHVKIENYSPSGRVEDFVFYILTSRGCPKGCSMCPYFVHQGKQWRFRSTDNVIAELDALRTMGARLIQTRDPNISWRKAHLLAITERLKGEHQFHITTETDLEALNETDMVALRDAGFMRIMTGVESVDESVLKDIHQNGNALKRSLSNMVLAKKLGIEVTGFFIVGSLHETWSSVRNTLATAKVLPIRYSVSLMTPYYGTEMREDFIKSGFYKEAKTFKEFNGYSPLIRTTGLSFPQVKLAFAWASAELELVTRERALEAARGAKQLYIALRVLRQKLRLALLRVQVDRQERQVVPALPVAV